MTSTLPLCVDCDGTLIRTDLLHESIMLMAKASTLSMWRLPFWLLRGRVYLKRRLAEQVTPDARTLPYEPEIIALIQRARSAGRTVVLATASPRSQAQAVAEHLGLFDRVEATDSTINLAGDNKAAHLVSLYGAQGFEYAGDSRKDLPVWAASGGAIVVSRSSSLRAAVETRAKIVQVVTPARRTLAIYAKQMRVHQWLKNLLVFIPMLAGHQLNSTALVLSVLAFAAFSLCASSVYVLNDLLDLPSDRAHVRKRNRPFASGALPIAHGAVLVPVLLVLSAVIALWLPPLFGLSLLAYFAVTCLYSFWLKNQVVVDVLLLASLYTSRIIAGAAATSIAPSFWLLAFSMFIFLSLAIVKRYSEMLVVHGQNKTQAAGRGYLVSDMPVLLSLGTSSGYMAVMVMALYMNSGDIGNLYPNRGALWLVLPPLLYWISRIWMKAHRGELHDDPIVFAATDRQTWILGFVMALALIIASKD